MDVSLYAAEGDGSPGNPWHGWENGIQPVHARLHFRAGYFQTDGWVTTQPNVTITGYGVGISTILSRGRSGAITWNNPAGVQGRFEMRDLSIHQTGDGLKPGKAVIELGDQDNSRRPAYFLIRDVRVSGDAGAYEKGTGLKIHNMNYGVIDNFTLQGKVGTTRTWETGIALFPGEKQNRGNITIVGGYLQKVRIGVRIGGDAIIVNNFQLLGLKAVDEGSADRHDPGTVGLLVEKGAETILVEGCHFEGFETGIRVDSFKSILTASNNLISLFAGDVTEHAGGYGIHLSVSAPRKENIDGVTIMNNKFSNIPTHCEAKAGCGAGIFLDKGVYKNLTVLGNHWRLVGEKIRYGGEVINQFVMDDFSSSRLTVRGDAGENVIGLQGRRATGSPGIEWRRGGGGGEAFSARLDGADWTLRNDADDEGVKVGQDGDLAIRGALGVGNAAPARQRGKLVRKIEVFDSQGRSLGYLPVYESID